MKTWHLKKWIMKEKKNGKMCVSKGNLLIDNTETNEVPISAFFLNKI